MRSFLRLPPGGGDIAFGENSSIDRVAERRRRLWLARRSLIDWFIILTHVHPKYIITFFSLFENQAYLYSIVKEKRGFSFEISLQW
jgi:hypothetical protein